MAEMMTFVGGVWERMPRVVKSSRVLLLRVDTSFGVLHIAHCRKDMYALRDCPGACQCVTVDGTVARHAVLSASPAARPTASVGPSIRSRRAAVTRARVIDDGSSP